MQTGASCIAARLKMSVERVINLELTGLVAIHAARAAYTALSSVPGIVSAQVTMAGAIVHVSGPFEMRAFSANVRNALAAVGIDLVAATVVQNRVLPLA